MEFQETFEWEVLDNNQPVLPPPEDGGTMEEHWNWRTMSEEPVTSRRWLELITECGAPHSVVSSNQLPGEGYYQAHVRAVLERFNPLRYRAQFDGGDLSLFEEGGGINLLFPKAFSRGDILYLLKYMNLKIGYDTQTTVIERHYQVDREEQNEVQYEYVENSINMNAQSEIRVSVVIRFRAS